MTREECVTNLTERLAAAYISYIRCHKAVDRTLNEIRGRKLGRSWLDLVDTILKGFSGHRRDNVLRFDKLRPWRPE